MIANKPGRPPKVGTLHNPPSYIKSRIAARNRSLPRHWHTFLINLDSQFFEVERYRKSHRIKFAEAGVIMNGICETICEKDILAIDARLPSMREMGAKGGVAKGKSIPIWKLEAKAIAKKYLLHSATRAAELMHFSWQTNNSPAPSIRTLRRYISKLRN